MKKDDLSKARRRQMATELRGLAKECEAGGFLTPIGFVMSIVTDDGKVCVAASASVTTAKEAQAILACGQSAVVLGANAKASEQAARRKMN